MPNQRSKNKAHLGGFVENELHAEIVRLAKKEGMEQQSVTKFLQAVLLFPRELTPAIKVKKGLFIFQILFI